jgi:hypothetical protein
VASTALSRSFRGNTHKRMKSPSCFSLSRLLNLNQPYLQALDSSGQQIENMVPSTTYSGIGDCFLQTIASGRKRQKEEEEARKREEFEYRQYVITGRRSSASADNESTRQFEISLTQQEEEASRANQVSSLQRDIDSDFDSGSDSEACSERAELPAFSISSRTSLIRPNPRTETFDSQYRDVHPHYQRYENEKENEVTMSTSSIKFKSEEDLGTENELKISTDELAGVTLELLDIKAKIAEINHQLLQAQQERGQELAKQTALGYTAASDLELQIILLQHELEEERRSRERLEYELKNVKSRVGHLRKNLKCHRNRAAGRRRRHHGGRRRYQEEQPMCCVIM